MIFAIITCAVDERAEAEPCAIPLLFKTAVLYGVRERLGASGTHTVYSSRTPERPPGPANPRRTHPADGGRRALPHTSLQLILIYSMFEQILKAKMTNFLLQNISQKAKS